MNDAEIKLDKKLDLMASQLLSGREIEFSESILDWYRNDYKCSLVPRPSDTDETRLAVKASIIERLVEVLNSPPRQEGQSDPTWCREISSLKEPLKLQSDRLLEGEQFCEAFARRNLFVVKNFMYFI
jgi:hypothetical protein